MIVDLVVHNGKIVTPAGTFPGGVAVSEGKIVAIATESALPPAQRTIDAGGNYILPGLVDPEGHLAGSRPIKDGFVSETCAALASGVTTWGVQVSSTGIKLEEDGWPPTDEDIRPFSEVMPLFKELGDRLSRVDYFLTPVVTTDEQVAEIPQLAERYGVTSYKFYLHMKQGLQVASKWHAQKHMGFTGFDDGTVYLALENVARIGPPGIVSIHPENWEIVRIFEDRLKKQGRKDMAAWDERSPHFCEAGHVWAYAYYAKVTGCPLYIQHVTTQETLDVIQKLRADGVKVYGQTSACYLSLPNDVWKLNVPLRDRETIEKLWVAVSEGIVDCSGTDHVNTGKSREQMEIKGDMWATSSGFPSRVEAYLPVMLSEGVNKGRISLEKMVELCCENPARIFGLYPKKGVIAVGSDADLVIVDLDLTKEVKREMIQCGAGWSIYEGWQMKGWPVMVILRGNVVMDWPADAPRARMVGEPIGRYLPRKPGHQTYRVE
ncbi:MAG: amidohydrolase family protein [Chloroflexi bacterium]|nr:amidohydrolase family protein [Chloroflexota bacterium]